MLKFLGIGGYDSFELKANSAYYKLNDGLILIDCGDTTFRELVKEGLDYVKDIYIVITHLHNDHAGSLDSLVYYCINKLKITPKIVYPNIKAIKKYMQLVGNNQDSCIFFKEISSSNLIIKPFKQKHLIEGYGYYLTINEKKIYYSGDGSKIIKSAIKELIKGKIDYFFQEVAPGEVEGHFNIYTLADLISKKNRFKIICMHFSNQELIETAKNLGFSIAEID